MLFCLWVWGPHETRDLATRMGVSRPTVSGVTDTLERRTLVERRGHAEDARRRTVALTAAGERTFEELFPRFNSEESLACAGLDAEARTQLAALLRTLVTTLRGGT
jgi:DNA-binding MarR family transcriptional regulator